MIVITVMIVVAFAGRTVVMAMVVVGGCMYRHHMTVGIVAETVVADDMVAPVRMDFFPVVKARHANRIKRQPDIARPQIKIRAANDADEFYAVPDVSVRN